MIDLSDGLLRDTARVAAASGVRLDLASASLAADVARLEPAVGAELARECVLCGGEEHSLLATFPSGSAVPEGFRVIGAVRAGSGVAWTAYRSSREAGTTSRLSIGSCVWGRNRAVQSTNRGETRRRPATP